MPSHNEKLLENFPHLRVVAKSFVNGLVLLGTIQVLQDFWPPANALKAWLYGEFWNTPLLFVLLYAMTLLLECILRLQRYEVERLRSNPVAGRSARRKAKMRKR